MKKRLIGLVIVMLVGATWVSAAAAATRPRNTALPTIGGTARQGEVLTADPGTWSGTQPMTFAYQWRRCDANGASCASIVGATAKTYTLTSADVGNRLRVRVRASNDAGARTATSAATAVVVAVPKTVSLDVSQSAVLYGRAVTLFGSVANGQLGEAVTVTARQLPSFNVAVRAVATVQTTADGSFSLLVRPMSHTLYTASNGQTTSNAVSISVRPRVSLTRSTGHRFVLRAVAARSFVGRYGVVQRWSLRRHQWLSVKRVFFTRAFPGVSPTITSRAVFRARLGGARIRVLVPRSPGYLTGVSNIRSA
jgi:hypothetical protein